MGGAGDGLLRPVARILAAWMAQASPRGVKRFGAGGESRPVIRVPDFARRILHVIRAGRGVTLQIPVDLFPDGIVVHAAHA